MIYNKPKAKIFMGDSGSIFLAYLIGFCSIELIILGKWHIVISLLSYTFLDCTITLIKKTIDGHAPWARLFDYYFLKPIRINKKNNFLVFRYNLIYNFLNLTIVFFQVYLDLKYLFVLSIAFSLILMNKYKNFSNN
jgi:UDP-N-acetylmuramyl pentapeptide phosphotransferase/UDP-N-acetylglucosamine-1-phosphate transferase